MKKRSYSIATKQNLKTISDLHEKLIDILKSDQEFSSQGNMSKL